MSSMSCGARFCCLRRRGSGGRSPSRPPSAGGAAETGRALSGPPGCTGRSCAGRAWCRGRDSPAGRAALGSSLGSLGTYRVGSDSASSSACLPTLRAESGVHSSTSSSSSSPCTASTVFSEWSPTGLSGSSSSRRLRRGSSGRSSWSPPPAGSCLGSLGGDTGARRTVAVPGSSVNVGSSVVVTVVAFAPLTFSLPLRLGRALGLRLTGATGLSLCGSWAASGGVVTSSSPGTSLSRSAKDPPAPRYASGLNGSSRSAAPAEVSRSASSRAARSTRFCRGATRSALSPQSSLAAKTDVETGSACR